MYSTIAGIQGLASCEQIRRVTGWRKEEEVADGRTEALSVLGDRGQAAISLQLLAGFNSIYPLEKMIQNVAYFFLS